MVSRVIRNEADIDALGLLLRARKLPVTISVTAGAQRTAPQNRLQRQWCKDAAEQLGDRTAEEVRAYSKLHFGVPILRAENEAYCAEYDATIRPLPYEMKLRLMAAPFDLAVTREMTVKQLTAYLDEMGRHWASLGVRLTDPEALRFGQAA